jgi:hypothetical protein
MHNVCYNVLKRHLSAVSEFIAFLSRRKSYNIELKLEIDEIALDIGAGYYGQGAIV